MKHQHRHGYQIRYEHVNTYNVQNIKRNTGVVSILNTDTRVSDTKHNKGGTGVTGVSILPVSNLFPDSIKDNNSSSISNNILK